jgi:arylsulfatase A-like enzyme
MEVPYNVILVSFDTLRRDHLGAYGYGKDVSPNLDRLAREGVVFEDGVANCGWTLPQHVTMLTGQYPIRHGLVHLRRKRQIPTRYKTLAEVFGKAGYFTLGFCNQNSYGGGWRYGFQRGMRSYTTVFHFNNMMESAVRHINAYMELLRDKPFFMYIHTNDTHEHFAASEPFGSMWGSEYENRYEGEVTYVDHYFGQVLEKLEELGIADRTLVVATSDHGTEFREHGFLEKKLNLYEEIVQVPLIMRLPGVLPAGLKVPGPAETIDIAPTIMDICSAEQPVMDGVSLMPRMRGEGLHREFTFAHTLHETLYWYEHWSVRTPDSKLIRTQPLAAPKRRKNLVADRFERLSKVGVKSGGGWVELYDLDDDPGERENLASTEPGRVRSMERRIRTWVKECGYAPHGSWPSSGGHQGRR